ncbi:MAG: NAD(P)-dependent oxidoreductase, partial [Candidatus Heimdallarchaeota archaeon]|nr:NAD(P)-dependent oxidoreductase [Candidatus Heimdallarchaeota archaeon]
VEQAVKGMDVVIHVGAIIPPLADKLPKFAHNVNVGGTRNIIRAMETFCPTSPLIYTSSIAVYGDRRENPIINTTDPLIPSSHDEYAKQKLEAESLIQYSKLTWSILRLTYITSMNKLKLDPLMYEMPLETCIEICDTKDVGLALVNTINNPKAKYKIFNIAGGQSCQTTFGEYLMTMFDIFGFGAESLPAEAFYHTDFHCGWLTTHESQKILQFQRTTLISYYEDVRRKVRSMRFWVLLFRPIAKQIVLQRSPYIKKIKKPRKSFHTIYQYLVKNQRLSNSVKSRIHSDRKIEA